MNDKVLVNIVLSSKHGFIYQLFCTFLGSFLHDSLFLHFVLKIVNVITTIVVAAIIVIIIIGFYYWLSMMHFHQSSSRPKLLSHSQVQM